MISEKELTRLLYDTLIRNTSGLEWLLKKGASPNLILSEYGVTPFHIAAGIGQESLGFHATKLFLKYGGNPNIRSVEGITPVHVAAMWGKAATLYLLLINGGDPWLTDEDGRNAFQHAQLEQQVNTLQLLTSYQLQDECVTNSVDSKKYSITLDKVVLFSQNVSLEYVTEPATHLEVPETRSTSTQTSYFRSSLMVVETEEKQSDGNKLSGKQGNGELLHTREDFLKFTNNENNKVVSVNKGSKCYVYEDFANELKIVLTRREVTGSLKVRDISDTGSSNKSVKEDVYTCDTLLHSGSSNINTASNIKTASNLPEVPSERNREVSKGAVTEEFKSFEKYCSVLSHCQVKGSVSLATEETDSAQLQVIGTEKDDCVYDSLSKCMADDLSVDFACENHTKDESVEDAAYLSSMDMFGSLLSEDNESAVQDYVKNSYHDQNHAPQVSDLITSDEDDPLVSCPKVYIGVESQNSLVPLCEQYKYTDIEEGIILLEKIFLVQHDSMPLLKEDGYSSSVPDKEPDVSVSSTTASFPISLDYDSDTLRNDLKKLGQDVGPVTATTKRVYLKKLYALHRDLSLPPPTGNLVREYSSELQQALDNIETISLYAPLENAVAQQFAAPDPTFRWREGVLKTSFTYLLLDPSVSCNLPCRSESLSQREQWSTFLAAVFYIGKGRRSRPYAHLYEAVTAWKKPRRHVNSKVRQILDIWHMGLGVVCLHVFQTVIPVEAFTREAAMIDAIGLKNLKNSKRGEYYGVASMWTKSKQQQLGTYLLYRAMQMFLIEGERQLRPDDI